MAHPCFPTVLKVKVTEGRHIFRIDGMGAMAAVGVVPALEAIIMEIAVVAIAGFQYSGLRLMNFDGLVTELAGPGHALTEVGATGGTPLNAVLDQIAIAMFV